MKKCKHVPGASKRSWHCEEKGLSGNILKTDAKNKHGEALLYGSIIDEDEDIVYRLAPDADGANQIIATATDDFDPEMDPIEAEDDDDMPFTDLEQQEQDWWLRRRRTLEHESSSPDQDDSHRHLSGAVVLDVMVPWTGLAG